MFDNNELVGVIDPSPMIGPVTYDFTYAFCSSPDDLNLETLLSSFDLLNDNTSERSRIIHEVLFQLYCRIGICVKVHPHDLNDYLKSVGLLETFSYIAALTRPSLRQQHRPGILHFPNPFKRKKLTHPMCSLR
ncbi:hypothetical protein [Paenibacillus thalictri]|uniref:hypothetical protein n=1 Tax=Paenibacillus thalictri TaxID=2527873 RepID=UPI001F0E3F64|nr:hypothetical protein [Paenibacillus thalictri]